MKRAAASLVIVGGLAGGAMGETVLYSNDFEVGSVGPEWSSNTYLSQATPFTRFNGRYSPGYTVLTLAYPAVTPPGEGSGDLRFRVTFDLYTIDSWDGDASTQIAPSNLGPDRFSVSVNGVNVFRESFTNMPGGTQTFRAPDIGPIHLGYNSAYMDSIYRGISVDFLLAPGSPMVIRWEDSGLEGLTYESWGIDNVRVGYTAVPAPGSLALLAGGALVLRRRR